MPESLGNPYKNSSMVTPLGAEPGKKDPGPPVLNNPIESPDDALGFVEPIRKGKGGSKTRGAGKDRP